jgi:uncharacterized protein (TIGR02246 family)
MTNAHRELVATWMTASQAGDIDTVLGLMTDDVVFMVPVASRSARGVRGRLQAWRARMEGNSDIRELVVLGDIAYLRNHIAITITPPGCAPMRRAGCTLTILRQPGWPLAARPRRQSVEQGRVNSPARVAVQKSASFVPRVRDATL